MLCFRFCCSNGNLIRYYAVGCDFWVQSEIGKWDTAGGGQYIGQLSTHESVLLRHGRRHSGGSLAVVAAPLNPPNY